MSPAKQKGNEGTPGMKLKLQEGEALDFEQLQKQLDHIAAELGEETARPFVYYWDGAYRC